MTSILDQNLAQIIQNLISQLSGIEFYGKVYRNDEETCINTVYVPEPSRMIYVYGLSGELPRVIRLKEGGIVEGAFAGTYCVELRKQPETFRIYDKSLEWKEFPRESGLDIFWLLDPRKLLSEAKISGARIEAPGVVKYISVEYNALQLGLSETAKKFLKQHGEESRVAHLYLVEGKLSRLTQKDIPPLQDQVTVIFSYY